MEVYVTMIKESVNSTISNSHWEYKNCIDQFLGPIDREVKTLGWLEVETDKRYKEFEQMITEAEVAMAKELPFAKDFWLTEHNFIKSSDNQLLQQ